MSSLYMIKSFNSVAMVTPWTHLAVMLILTRKGQNCKCWHRYVTLVYKAIKWSEYDTLTRGYNGLWSSKQNIPKFPIDIYFIRNEILIYIH